MKYKCLVLDHDDTMVKSTPNMHFPSFLETLKELRPGYKMTLEDFFEKSFDPGFFKLCTDILKYDENEMKIQYEIWHKNTSKVTPEFFKNALEAIETFKKRGGLVTIVSHSSVEMIKRHYKEKTNIIPDMIFGFDSKYMKPNSWPLNEIMKKYNLKANEIVVIDDLKPGYDMAKAKNVDFLWAGWSHKIDKLVNFMEQNATHCLYSDQELAQYIL